MVMWNISRTKPIIELVYSIEMCALNQLRQIHTKPNATTQPTTNIPKYKHSSQTNGIDWHYQQAEESERNGEKVTQKKCQKHMCCECMRVGIIIILSCCRFRDPLFLFSLSLSFDFSLSLYRCFRLYLSQRGRRRVIEKAYLSPPLSLPISLSRSFSLPLFICLVPVLSFNPVSIFVETDKPTQINIWKVFNKVSI